MKRAALIGITLALILAPTTESQERERRTVRNDARDAGKRVIQTHRGSRATQGIGVIQYDPGSPAGVRFANAPNVFIGNLFDTQSGAPLSPGTLYAISWYHGPATGKGYASFMIVPSTAASPILGSLQNVQTYATNVASFSPISVVPPFFVGIAAGAPKAGARGQSSFTQIGYATLSTNSQGFHGSQRTFSGGGPGARAPITSQNLLVRATGSVAIPVELLEFEVE